MPRNRSEIHHIVPRCLGGNDSETNLVRLTSREHYIAHLCLVKINPRKPGLILAATMMAVGNRSMNRSGNRIYEWLRQKHRAIMKQQVGAKNSQFGTLWIHHFELKQSKKINEQELPKWQELDWQIGRIMDFSRIRNCPVCQKQFYSPINKKTCSTACVQILRSSGCKLDGREHEFLSLYKSSQSINKSLKAMGVKGAVSSWYHWAKKVIAQTESK